MGMIRQANFDLAREEVLRAVRELEEEAGCSVPDEAVVMVGVAFTFEREEVGGCADIGGSS
jgi:8-oxo-dGTP pyrophosphatase MutT (NUDIX family)